VSISGRIHKISISKTKGSRKKNTENAVLSENHGIIGDAHAGSARQVSLLPLESFSKMDSDLITIAPGDFAENITTVGIDYTDSSLGDRLKIGKEAELIITQIGKECHNDCPIRQKVGDCIMPREGIFARVETGGEITVGDKIKWI
jgi:MOSC domain-containing protein YiiM